MNRDPEFIESLFRQPLPTLASIPNGEPLGTIRYVAELEGLYRKEVDSINNDEAWRPYPSYAPQLSVVLQAPNGNLWRLTVDDSGVPVTTLIS